MAGLGPPNYTEFGVTLLTPEFQIRGKLHVLGTVGMFLNDAAKPNLIIYDADVMAVDAANPAKVSRPEIVISKRIAQIIAFDQVAGQGEVQLLPKTENMLAYLDRCVVQGTFLMGEDARFADFAEASLQQFILITNFKIYPLFQAKPGIIPQAQMGMIQKTSIRMYHKA